MQLAEVNENTADQSAEDCYLLLAGSVHAKGQMMAECIEMLADASKHATCQQTPDKQVSAEAIAELDTQAESCNSQHKMMHGFPCLCAHIWT